MSKVKALHDRVIMKEVDSQEKLHGAIIVPDTGGERSNMYEVIDHGPGEYNPQFDKYIPVAAKIGDIVIVPKGLVYNIKVDGTEYFLTRDKEIQAVIQ